MRRRRRLERPGEITLLDEGIGNKHRGAERPFAGWGHEVEMLIRCDKCKQIVLVYVKGESLA